MIGFTGPYSDVNFGDYAMLVNNVFALEAEEATVFVYDRPFVEKIRDGYLADRDVRLVDVELSDELLAGRDHRFLTPVEILRSVRNIDEVTGAVADLDVLYVNGGGYLNSLWTQPHRIERLLKIIVPALVASSLNKPVVFTANGYGPFRGDLEFFASLFGSLPGARFGVRDSILSPHWLSQAGIPRDRIALLPDDLLFIHDRLVPADQDRGGDRYVVLETYMPTEYLAENIAHFEEFSDRMSDHDLKIVFLPFNLAHGGVDQGELLRGRLTGFELFDIRTRGYLAIEDAVTVIGNAEMVISNRYHAVILALSLGVPFASVLKDVLGDKQYYYGKNAGALAGVLGGQPHDLRDYFFTDYAEALGSVGGDFDAIVRRQHQAYGAAFPTTSKRLRQARESFLRGQG